MPRDRANDSCDVREGYASTLIAIETTKEFRKNGAKTKHRVPAVIKNLNKQ